MSQALPYAGSFLHARRTRSLTDRYFWLLGLTLVGYACLGKAFAYIGVFPIFIGEIVFVLGLLALLYTGCAMATLASFPSMVLSVLLSLAVINAMLSLSIYGFNALRDSVIIVYGLFAFIVIALLIEKPERLQSIMRAYSRFALIYGVVGVALVYALRFLGNVLPAPAELGIDPTYLRPGEVAIHISGVAVFVLLGFRRVPKWWPVCLLLGIMAMATNRGSLVACGVSIGIAAVVGGQLRRMIPSLLVAAVVFAGAYAGDFEVSIQQQDGSIRGIGPQHLINDIESIIGTSDAANLDGTKEWRLRWWRTIADYTLNGPYFWTGKGFGVNLAESDGFVVGEELKAAPLRSPHNGHMNILARLGVPGFALWILLLSSWFGMLLRYMILARRRGDDQYANLFLWAGCYGIAMLVDATFDVALEGPMVGIWFWCVFGFGIASVMIYRTAINACRPDLRRIVP